MDALARIEPVARALLREVDAALATLGAPAGHPVWPLLRRLGVTPADAVACVAHPRAGSLRTVGEAIREQVAVYPDATVPEDLPWRGLAGERYAERARALNEQLIGPDSALARAYATASYLDDVAGWWERCRDRVAAALAQVLTSTQAVALTGGTRPPAAAADIGAHVLRAVADGLAWGEELARRHADLPASAAPGPSGPVDRPFDQAIQVRP